MKKRILLASFLVIITAVYSQKTTIKILDFITKNPISNVHVKANKKVYVSNEKGEIYFQSNKRIDNKLEFTHIKYQTLKIVSRVNIKELVVYLHENSRSLTEVKIFEKRKLKKELSYTNLQEISKRTHSFASVLIDGKIYVFGGDGSLEVDVYRKALDEVKLDDDISAFLKQVKKYHSFYTYRESLNVYDFKEKRWKKEEVKFRKRANHKAIHYNNKVYLIGGKRLSKSKRKDFLDDKIEVYDLKKKTIKIDNTNPHQAVNPEAFLYGNKMVVLGGSIKQKKNGEKEFSKEIHTFNFKTGLWYLIGKAPITKDIKVELIQDKLYFFGGKINGNKRLISSLNLISGKWKKEGLLPYAINNPAITKKDNTIYLFENQKLISFETESKTINEYKIRLNLFNPEMYYHNNQLYILGGYTEIDFEKEASKSFYSVSLKEFKNTKNKSYSMY